MVARHHPACLSHRHCLCRCLSCSGRQPETTLQPLHSGLELHLCRSAAESSRAHGFSVHDGFQPKLGTGPELQPAFVPGSIYIQFAVYAIASIGVIGIARGLCLIRDTPNQSMNLSRGLVHLFGGILAVNLVTFLRGLGATVGGDVQTYIANIIG